MLDKNTLLMDLIKLKLDDENKLKHAETIDEIYSLKGSIMNLETIIEFIEEGRYDKP